MARAPGAGGAGCSNPAGSEGDTIYNKDYYALQYCDGTNWVVMGTRTLTGLVIWWNFDEGSGTSAADSSGNGYTGALTGTPAWVTAHNNGGLSFNAAHPDQVQTTNSLYFGAGSFTYAAWVNTTQSVSQVRIVGSKIAAGTSYIWVNEYISAGLTGFSTEIRDDAAAAFGVQSGLSISDGLWHHVALVVDRTGNMIYLYVDGVAVSSTAHTFTGNFGVVGTPFTATTAGDQGANPTFAYQGTIDDVRIYNRALGAGEIAHLYNGGP
jgi:Concanavalin A-like lectin/glucanases superfamily